MGKKEILNFLRENKQKYLIDGFIILGLFGSYVRGEETEESDIDILFEMTKTFYDKFPGWNAFPEIDKIKNELENKLGKKIDLTDKNALKKIGKKYILPEVNYV